MVENKKIEVINAHKQQKGLSLEIPAFSLFLSKTEQSKTHPVKPEM